MVGIRLGLLESATAGLREYQIGLFPKVWYSIIMLYYVTLYNND